MDNYNYRVCLRIFKKISWKLVLNTNDIMLIPKHEKGILRVSINPLMENKYLEENRWKMIPYELSLDIYYSRSNKLREKAKVPYLYVLFNIYLFYLYVPYIYIYLFYFF